jgi:SAM-dependent methyltransferase
MSHSDTMKFPHAILLQPLLLVIFIPALYSFVSATEQTSQKKEHECGPNALWFLGHCFCEPGWIDETHSNPNQYDDTIDDETHMHLPAHLAESYDLKSLHTHKRPKCTKPLLEIGDCVCERDKPNDRSFLKDPNWMHPEGVRCQSLCHICELGVITSNITQWADLESDTGAQIPYFREWLPPLLKPQNRNDENHIYKRLGETSAGFEGFKALEGRNFGSAIEFACGPYTQTRHIMERVNITLDSIHLSDPIQDQYVTIEGCTYFQKNAFEVNKRKYPTVLHNLATEDWGKWARQERIEKNDPAHLTFDTVIFVNSLPYHKDAVETLTTLFEATKPGGLLIFSDRWYENWISSSTCGAFAFNVNPVQVSKLMIYHFLSKFHGEPFLSFQPTFEQQHASEWHCFGQVVDFEPGMYVAVTKLQHNHTHSHSKQ